MKKIFFLFLISIQLINAQELALIKKEGKFGLIKNDGTFAIAPTFDSARDFSDGLAAVKENGKWGFVDNTGAFVIPPTFDNAKDFDSGICVIEKDAVWHYINKKGEILEGNPKSDKLFDFHYGVAFFRQNDKVGLINNKFEIVLAPKYDVIRAFYKGYARAALNDKWGIIDTSGKEVAEVVYDEVGDYFNNTTWAKKGKAYGLVHNGVFIEIPDVTEFGPFGTQDFIAAKKGGKFGFVDFEGQWVLKPMFQKAKGFSQDLAPVLLREKWGYTNLKGECIVQPIYNDADPFSENGLAAVKILSDWGFIDKTGNLVIPADYEISAAFGSYTRNEKGFINGLARVKRKGKWSFLKPNGDLLIEWSQNAELFQK
ncbi:WG containing repeat-containing protein [Flavobacterium resistens]|uniref:WG containing repeat-containing protein n=1 Tax=Flavobacterium resistens TaxID=443612 RepID=A0A521C262_9FLAO|nr:WG repeat-containing protein [Flavobacterium resistens]MRX69654.1 WG repeat-containing protein [Flavobacterium resistens]SMO53489.1 WG containing repeat-containing protein [Flavobacterium resistens]